MSDGDHRTKEQLRDFILAEFLPGEPAENLVDSTPLIAGSIIDSIGMMKLLLFIEEKFGVELEPDEMGEEFLGTIANIINTVKKKTARM